jgi:hypothetical protein
LEPIQRSEFREMMLPLIREQFDVCLRNELRIDERQGVRGWKDLKLSQFESAGDIFSSPNAFIEGVFIGFQKLK